MRGEFFVILISLMLFATCYVKGDMDYKIEHPAERN